MVFLYLSAFENLKPEFIALNLDHVQRIAVRKSGKKENGFLLTFLSGNPEEPSAWVVSASIVEGEETAQKILKELLDCMGKDEKGFINLDDIIYRMKMQGLSHEEAKAALAARGIVSKKD